MYLLLASLWLVTSIIRVIGVLCGNKVIRIMRVIRLDTRLDRVILVFRAFTLIRVL